MDKLQHLQILVFFDQDRVFTNFLTTGAFYELTQRHRVHFVVPPCDKRMRIDPRSRFAHLDWITLPPDQERAGRWGRIARIVQLRWRPGEYWRKIRRLRRLQMRKRRWEWIILSILSLPGLATLETWRQLRKLTSTRFEALESLLDRVRPDVVIHPTALNGLFVNDIIQACRTRSIPSVLIMNSWDNPSTKNAVTGAPDFFLVWGNQTANHARRYMGLDQSRIVVMGAAQFETHATEGASTSSSCASKLGLNPSRPIFLFAASSILGSDYQRLKRLEAWCATKGPNAPQILYRPYPWRRIEGEIVSILSENWRHVIVQREVLATTGDGDFGETAINRKMAISAADAVLSPLSTVIVEAMLMRKAVMCIYPVRDMHSEFGPANAPLVHFKEILNNPDVVVSRDDDELPICMDALLEKIGRADDLDRLAKSVEFVVQPFSERYGVRLCRFIETLQAKSRPLFDNFALIICFEPVGDYISASWFALI
jgi:hypothetical protein